MTWQLSVSPDFSPDHIAGWYVFNTWLQRRLGERIHLALHDSFDEHRQAIVADQIDIIYANPHDAAMLVREKGFVAIAAPQGVVDEVVVAVPESAPTQAIEELPVGLRLVTTRDPGVNLIGMILLEPANLNRDTVVAHQVGSYVLVAKHLLTGRADVGFFLKDAFDDLSAPVRRQLRGLVTSQISLVHHVMLVGPRCAALHATLRELLLGMHLPGSDGAGALQALGIAGWRDQQQEDTEFMIDLVDTLMG